MMEYRRRKKSDVWHSHNRCRWWPSIEGAAGLKVVVRDWKPTTGELCDECLAKQRRDDKNRASRAAYNDSGVS